MATYNFVVHKGRHKDLVAAIDKKGQKPNGWSPSLRQTLRWIIEKSGIDLQIDPQALAAARSFANDSAGELCLDDLDKFTHNKYMPPSPERLRAIWKSIDPIMRIFLTEPK